MSERYQNGYFALVLICLIGLFAIGYVSITFSFSKGYQSADQEHSAYYAQRDTAEIAYRECIDAAANLDGARECINNTPETSREAERAEQDLNAQREMAQWAEGMLWAAWIVGLFTVGATIVGVRYVYLTLIATQDMARETTRIGEAQVRAYPSVTSIEFDGITNGLPAIAVTVKNFGSSPALKMKCRGQLTIAYQEETAPKEIAAQRSSAIDIVSRTQAFIAPGSTETIQIYAPYSGNNTIRDPFRDIVGQAKRLNPYWSVEVFLDWVDVFDHHYTFCSNALQVPHGGAIIDWAMSQRVLKTPFKIDYQSDSTEHDGGG